MTCPIWYPAAEPVALCVDAGPSLGSVRQPLTTCISERVSHSRRQYAHASLEFILPQAVFLSKTR